MPPLDAYKVRPPFYDRVSTSTNQEARYQFFGWDNLTTFEVEAIANTKVYLETVLKVPIPESLLDREILKFLQANYFNM